MATATNERRGYSRFSCEAIPCAVTLRSNSQKGFVVEESIGGVRVTGLQLKQLDFNETVHVEVGEDSTEGICRNIFREKDGSFSIGIKNGPDSLSGPPKILLGCFLKHGTQTFACRFLSETDSKYAVQLIDGKSFLLSPDLIEFQTRSERFKRIQNDAALIDLLPRLYQVRRSTDIKPDSNMLDTILDFEFSVDSFVQNES